MKNVFSLFYKLALKEKFHKLPVLLNVDLLKSILYCVIPDRSTGMATNWKHPGLKAFGERDEISRWSMVPIGRHVWTVDKCPSGIIGTDPNCFREERRHRGSRTSGIRWKTRYIRNPKSDSRKKTWCGVYRRTGLGRAEKVIDIQMKLRHK